MVELPAGGAGGAALVFTSGGAGFVAFAAAMLCGAPVPFPAGSCQMTACVEPICDCCCFVMAWLTPIC